MASRSRFPLVRVPFRLIGHRAGAHPQTRIGLPTHGKHCGRPQASGSAAERSWPAPCAVEKATPLLREVIEVPENDIVFDNPEYASLNMDSIAKAMPFDGRWIGADGRRLLRPPAKAIALVERVLLQNREVETRGLRRAAIRALAHWQWERDLPLRIVYDRLVLLKQKRPDDRLYQETLHAFIEDFVEKHKGP